MKRLQKIAIVVIAITLFITNSAVENTYAKSKSSVKNIKVTNVKNKKIKLRVGQSKTLKTKVSVKGKISKKLIYKSSNKKVATVSKKGKIKAKKVGTAKITVISKANNKKKVTIKVSVVKKITSVESTTKPDTQKPTNKPTTGQDETTKIPTLNKEESGSGDSADFGEMFGEK